MRWYDSKYKVSIIPPKGMFFKIHEATILDIGGFGNDNSLPGPGFTTKSQFFYPKKLVNDHIGRSFSVRP